MPRPRIDGFDEKLIASFIERGLYKNQKEVVSAALRLLAEHQMEVEAAANATTYTDDTYAQQLEESSNAAVGNLARQTAVR
jgi:Arc/MetJ-type ribon-helix-helix transcriptional regulator